MEVMKKIKGVLEDARGKGRGVMGNTGVIVVGAIDDIVFIWKILKEKMW